MPTYVPDSPRRSILGHTTATFLVASELDSSEYDLEHADIVLTGTGDHTKINDCAAEIAESPTKGIIELADGTVQLSAGLNIDGSKVAIVGRHFTSWGRFIRNWNGSLGTGAEGFGGAKIKALTSGFNLLTISNSNIPDPPTVGESRHRNIWLEKLYFYGAGDSTAIIAGGAANHDMCGIKDVFVHNVAKGLDASFDAGILENFVAQDISGDAITLSGALGRILKCLLYDIGGTGITLNSLHGTSIQGCNIGDCAVNGIYLSSCFGAAINGNTIYNLSGVTTQRGIASNGGRGTSISGNTLEFLGNVTEGMGIGIDTPSDGFAIDGNTLYKSASIPGKAINIYDSTNCAVGLNSITGGGWNSGSSNTIYEGVGSGNVVRNNAGSSDTPKQWIKDTLVGLYLARDLNTLLTTSGGSTHVAANNDKIGRWKDLSGNGYDWIQTNASSPDWRPKWESAGVNSKPSVTFSGAQILEMADAGSYAGHPRTLWVMIGFQAANESSRVIMAYAYNTAWTDPYADWMIYQSTPTGFNTRVASDFATSTVSNMFTAASVLSYDNLTGKVFQNNNLSAGSLGSAAAITFPNTTGMVMGGHNASGTLGECMSGKVTGIILATAPPAPDIQLLCAKYIAGETGVATTGF